MRSQTSLEKRMTDDDKQDDDDDVDADNDETVMFGATVHGSRRRCAINITANPNYQVRRVDILAGREKKPT